MLSSCAKDKQHVRYRFTGPDEARFRDKPLKSMLGVESGMVDQNRFYGRFRGGQRSLWVFRLREVEFASKNLEFPHALKQSPYLVSEHQHQNQDRHRP